MTEARCTKCGETFIPSGGEDERVVDGETHYEHYVTEDGDACGGYGPIIGEWFTCPHFDRINDDTPMQPGTEGFWPVIAARMSDVRVGDRLTLPDDGYRVIVTATEIVGGCRRRWTGRTPDGDESTQSCGLLFPGPVHVDRWTSHATLAGSVR